MTRVTSGVVALLLAVSVCAPGGTLLKMVRAVRTPVPPVLDGLLGDSVWQLAPAVLDFTQFDPEEGSPPTELTSVRVLYNDRALYVGVICYDSRPDRIVQQLTRRDRSTEADRFTISIDSYFDRQSAFVFSTNVSGVQTDGVLSQGGVLYDITWDAVWDVRTRVYRDGWSAEFEIPFDALRFADVGEDTARWGINFRRYISRKQESDEWVMVPRSEQQQIPFWGLLTGISGITPPLHLDLSPYVSGSVARYSRMPIPQSTDRNVLAGLDAKYGLTRNFTLDGTVNPDFGQVEVDQAVLNLTVFETLYPEKRPFFTEGAMFFTFGSSFDNTPLALFFSRRIGKRPSGADMVPVSSGETIKENPQVTTIVGAAKVSGRSNDGLVVGVLSAVTGEENAIVQGAAGAEHMYRTEPQGVYNVARIRKEFPDGSWLGGIATMTGHESISPAFSGGVDWNLRFGEGTHSLDGYFAASHSSFSDQGVIGSAGRVLFSRISAEHWLYAGSYSYFSRSFDVNDVGFFAQPHDHGGYVQLMYREFFATGIFRRYAVSVVPEFRWNWDGVLTVARTEVTPVFEFENFWKASLLYSYRLPAYDDAEQGIIGTYRRPTSQALSVSVSSDQRQDVVATVSAVAETDALNKKLAAGTLLLGIRPASWMEFAPVVTYQVIRDQETGVLSGGTIETIVEGGRTVSLYADRDVDLLDFGLRGILTFTRKLSLQFYFQWLLARGQYTDYRALTGPADLVPVSPPQPNYDFNQATVNANLLLRWEYLPGSAAYLVWTQSRFGDSYDYSSGFAERMKDLSTLPTQNVLLLKLSYWFSL